MKRVVHFLRNKVEIVNDCGWKQIVAFILATVLSIIVSFEIYQHLDCKPATQSDYEDLENKLREVEHDDFNLNSLLKFESNCEVNINITGIVSITIENNRCKATATYDLTGRNFERLSMNMEDKCPNVRVRFLYAVIFIIAFFAFFYKTLEIIFIFMSWMLKKVISVKKSKK